MKNLTLCFTLSLALALILNQLMNLYNTKLKIRVLGLYILANWI